MNKFWIILSHTYLSKVKSKSFIISTAITLLVIIGLANLPTIIDTFSDDGEERAEQIAVIDESGNYFDLLDENLAAANEQQLEIVPVDESEEDVKQAVQDEEYEGLLVIETDENNLPTGTYYANRISDSGEQLFLQNQLQQLKIAIGTQQSGIDQETLEMIYAPVPFESTQLDETARTSEEMSQARGIVYVMLFVLYMAVIIYGQMIATDVAIEKSSKVMEILVSSASPITHMFAKIFGVALLGLTQVLLFLGVGYFMIRSKMDEIGGEFFEYMGLTNNDVSIYIYAVVFFLLGYFLYATLAAMLGSLVSRIEDVNQLIMPMIMLVMIAFFIAMFGLNAPESTLITVTSFIPFFAPMIMFLRVGMLNVPVWEIVLSFGLLIGTIALLAYIGAKVYSGGVLMYGKSGSLKDFKKAMKLSKKEK
ncbi:ABC transporter permease [Oceanobacillus iheyensis]|uniref:Hypothetical conserved protein n=1 Tax=Oceanobacillus iheyensis (strain DSM 14371 / CIP 107618 / JCM 11309 / KCTC 3954 / HTE831) TaxID=221109 RepID=Q8CUG8_OCEIH|nr:ABC transporter permease [Oceanobacillus iheyensis]BAC13095.1 hypothetical conserved protein [Oceanobacillus iheyensis HTE831]